jgi:hypothetical protein
MLHRTKLGRLPGRTRELLLSENFVINVSSVHPELLEKYFQVNTNEECVFSNAV